MAKKAGIDIKQEKSSGIFSKLKWGESYASLFLGLVIVVVAVVLVLSLGRNRQTKQTSSVQDSPKREEKRDVVKKDKTQKTYTVKKGDNLWSISEEMYKSGYNWLDIARANKLADPDQIFSGNRLIIPEVKVKTKAIKGNSYKITEGDNLWDIAVKAYGDGFKWAEIAKANKLSNPDLIFSENVLKIPR